MRLALIGLVTALIVVFAARAVTASPDPPWPGGVVKVWAPTQGTIDTMINAATRWNRSGADVHITVVRDRDRADVIVRRDDDKLHALCGRLCFGYTTVNGGPGELYLRESLDALRPLSLWVAVHELGHVLGLRHRAGHGCSVMAAHWYDTSCPPSMGRQVGSVFDPRCAPATVDIEAAVRLYGGKVTRDPYCSAT